ncbi:MAG TPA: uroporphyrinogen-III C-methyltransferase [bacterium]|nr:uroporphyrinogen-III C-methyltransferase [bacterium]
MNQNQRRNGKVYLVGAGPGDAGLLTLRGAEVLKRVDVIVYDWLVNPELLDLAPQAQKIYVGKNIRVKSEARIVKRPTLHGRIQGYVEQGKTNQLLVKLARQGKAVVRLKGGDPFIFGRGGEEASYLKRHHIPFEIVPGISAGYAAPAYAGIPVTDRRFASSVTFVTGHEDPAKKDSTVNWQQLAKAGGTLVSFMGVKNLPSVVQSLRAGGMKPGTCVSVIEWGTLPHQRVVEGTLQTIVSKVRAKRIQSPAVTVFGEVNRLRKKLAWFSAKKYREIKPLLGKSILVTRARAQASELRKMLEEKGAAVLEFPTIKILPPKNWGPLDKALKEIKKFDWIIFTSVNGVDSVFGRLDRLGRDVRLFSNVKIAAIGDATAGLLREKGLQPDLIPKAFTSEALFQALKRRDEINGRHFLLPRTDIAPDYLRTRLEKSGAKVTEVIAYRTVPVSENKTKLNRLFGQNKIDHVLFTSSSTVRNFFRAFSKREKSKIKARFVSIGPVTSRTIREYGSRPFREAKEHTIPGLVEVLTNGKN